VNGTLNELFAHLLLFWTGHQRDSGAVPAGTQANTSLKATELLMMRKNAHQLQEILSAGHCNLRAFGRAARQLATQATTGEHHYDWSKSTPGIVS
jgi:galactokinase/mevalonate kinase-like predicted kinase